MQRIEIFTGPGCSHCAAAKILLKEHGLPFTERNVSDAVVLEEFRQRLPRVRSLPQLFADGEHVGGYEDLRLHLKKDR